MDKDNDESMTSETWFQTSALRWLSWNWGERLGDPNSRGHVLQQAWRSDAGNIEWRDVPIVKWGDRDA
jgi:hypothetical protein